MVIVLNQERKDERIFRIGCGAFVLNQERKDFRMDRIGYCDI